MTVGQENEAAQKVVASFIYVDERSQSVARFDRIEPGRDGGQKEFLPYLALAEGGFAEEPGLRGTKLPLYRLDEVRTAIEYECTIFLTEGEGKADSLREVLRAANLHDATTTIAHGASAVLGSEHIAQLGGAKAVVVLADSDKPGRQAADKRGRQVAEAYRECDVRVLDLFAERVDGSDVADFLDEGGTIDELMVRVFAAHSVDSSPVVLAPPVTAAASWNLKSAAAIIRQGVAPMEWDIASLLPREDGPAVMFGPPGALKSWLALHAAGSIATGRPFLGHYPVRKRPHSIYINLDAGSNAFERRVIRTGYDVDNLLIASPDAYDFAVLRKVFKEYPGAFVVVDAFADAFRSGRGDDAAETMRRFVRDLRALYQEFECNGIIVDHPRRPRDGEVAADYYGSSQKEATARIMWQITPIPSSEPSVVRTKIVCRKLSEAEPFEPVVAEFTFTEETVTAAFAGSISVASGSITQGPTDAERCTQVLRDAPNGLKREAIQSLTGLSRDSVLAAVKASSEIEAVGKGRARRYVKTESNASSDDSPDESRETRNNRTDSPDALGACTIQGDSAEDNRTSKSSVAPDDFAEGSGAEVLAV